MTDKLRTHGFDAAELAGVTDVLTGFDVGTFDRLGIDRDLVASITANFASLGSEFAGVTDVLTGFDAAELAGVTDVLTGFDAAELAGVTDVLTGFDVGTFDRLGIDRDLVASITANFASLGSEFAGVTDVLTGFDAAELAGVTDVLTGFDAAELAGVTDVLTGFGSGVFASDPFADDVDATKQIAPVTWGDPLALCAAAMVVAFVATSIHARVMLEGAAEAGSTVRFLLESVDKMYAEYSAVRGAVHLSALVALLLAILGLRRT